MKILREIVDEGCASPEIRRGDFLDYFLEGMKKEAFITKDFIAFVMFGLLFASFESIPIMLSLALKLIMEHPLVLQELKVNLVHLVQFMLFLQFYSPLIFSVD